MIKKMILLCLCLAMALSMYSLPVTLAAQEPPPPQASLSVNNERQPDPVPLQLPDEAPNVSLLTVAASVHEPMLVASSIAGSYDQIALNNVSTRPDEAPFSIGTGSEQISTLSGGMSLRATDLILPGHHGPDFALTRIYDSNASQMYGMDVLVTDAQSSWGCQERGYSVCYYNQTTADYLQSRFPIGKGWTWNIPSVEHKNGKAYLHLPDSGTYEMNNNQLVGYPWKDLRYAADSTVQVDGQSSSVKVTSLQGISHFFSADGSLLQISDAYGNDLTFHYALNASNEKLLSRIANEYGNAITISYAANQIVLQQGSQTVTYQHAMQDGSKVLNQVVDVAGRSTSYAYVTKTAYFNLLYGADTGFVTSNPYTLLTQVTHSTGAKTMYTYETSAVTRQLGNHSGYNQAYRIAAREDQMFPAGNGTPEVHNHRDYTYAGDMGTMFGANAAFAVTVSEPSTAKSTTYHQSKQLRASTSTEVYTMTRTVAQSGSLKLTTTFSYTQGYPSPNAVSSQYERIDQGVTRYSQPVVSTQLFDEYGNVTSATNPLNATVTYTYDLSSHLLASSSEVLSPSQTRYTEYTRNAQGSILSRVVKETNASGAVKSRESYTYHPLNGSLLTTTVDDTGRQVVIADEYNPALPYRGAFLTKRSVAYKDADGTPGVLVQQMDYDTASAQLKSYTDGMGHTTNYVYDPAGRITQAVFADGSQVSVEYDDVHNEITYRDETGVRTRMSWNQLGWKISEGIVGQGMAAYGYDHDGRLAWSEDAGGHRTNYTTDAWGRVTQQADALGIVAAMNYDDVLRSQTVTDGEGQAIKTMYDPLGRVLTVEKVQPAGNKVLGSYAYDFAGNRLTATDANNYTTSYAYDIVGRLTAVTEPVTNATTRYVYSLGGLLTQIQYADGSIAQKQYDEVGRLLKKTDPLGQMDTYYYDADHQVTAHVDRKGQTTSYAYTAKHQLWRSITADETIEYTYDAAGRRTSMQDLTGTTSYDYEAATGRLQAVTYPDGKRTQYEYDLAGQRTDMLGPFGQTTAYGYDARNRLVGVGPTSNNWDEAYVEYDGNNAVKRAVQRNGITTSYAYDRNRLSQLTTTRGDGAVLQAFAYAYDDSNNMVSRTENGSSAAFTYDPLNRISTSSLWNEQYTYDARGNRLTGITGQKRDLKGSSYQYQYDDRNRLTEVTMDGSTTVSYRYNGDGLLWERTENGDTTRYYYDGPNVIAEGDVVSGTAAHKASYIRGLGLVSRVAANGEKAYYTKNGHGDIVGLQDSTGNPLNQYSYDIWGNPVTTQETIAQPFRYSGELWDSTTSLQYLRARWYDPSIGRFMNEDTYEGQIDNPLSLNLYTYVHNNPLTNVDPSGHTPVHSVVWELNKQLNDLKITWATENANGNIQARDAAAAEATKLRTDFLKLAEGMSELATQGLLLATDSVLAYHDIVADDGQTMTIAVNSRGTVFYEADFINYDYYEQVNVESKAERTMGTLAKAAAGYYIGYLIGKKVAPNTAAVNNGAGVAGVWAMDNYLPGVPNVGDVKTMIYRTNRDTGNIQHMIIDTNSYNLLKWKYFWETYK